MAYCENCGTPLPQQTAPSQPAPAPQNIAPTIDTTAAPTPTDPAAAAMPQPVMPVDQPPAGPDAGVAAPAEGANVIAAGAPAEGANVVAADPSEAPTIEAPPPQQATPAVPAAAGATTLTIIFPSGQLYTMQGDSADVGRADVAQNWHPDLDVIPFGGGAPDLGVSRHQGRLVRQDSGFVVIDVGSTNGTYVNGQAVPYNQPVELHDGDTLSFGALNTKLSIK
jgi:hypothetical protein